MPTIAVPGCREAVITVLVSTPRPEATPSHIIAAGAVHDEVASQVEAALMEYKHLAENCSWVPSAQQLGTYLPNFNGKPFYSARSLMPGGSTVEVDEDFLLDILRIRFAFTFAILPGSLMADERSGHAFNRHWQKAIKELFVEGLAFDWPVFIPGDTGERPDSTQIDVVLEMGGYQGRIPFAKQT